MTFMPLHLVKPNPTAPKVLHVRVIANAGGGPDKTIIRSAQYLDPMRYRMLTAYIHPKGSREFKTFSQQAAKLRCQLIEIPESGPINTSTYNALLKICREQSINIWHGHDYKSNLLGLLISRKLPDIKLVTTVHGWTCETLRTKLYYHVDNYCLKHYDEVVVVSPKLYEHCRNKLKIDASKLTYIPNAIRPEEYQQTHTRDQARAQLGIDTAGTVIGVVGRLSAEKGVDRAIDLMAKLPHCHLHLIGDGPERENLEKQAQKLGISDRVRFWGWQTSSQMFYQAMDLLLLPSHTEGLPNVVLEAMTMTVPVASTDVGGVRDLLDDGRCGLILPTEQPAAWAGMIETYLADQALLQQTALLARQRILTHFTFESRMQRMMRVYDKLGLSQQAAHRKAA